jgi:hypothetical protein
VKDKSGKKWKFLGDVPAVLNGWCQYLRNNGALLGNQVRCICGVEMKV